MSNMNCGRHMTEIYWKRRKILFIQPINSQISLSQSGFGVYLPYCITLLLQSNFFLTQLTFFNVLVNFRTRYSLFPFRIIIHNATARIFYTFTSVCTATLNADTASSKRRVLYVGIFPPKPEARAATNRHGVTKITQWLLKNQPGKCHDLFLWICVQF